MNINIDYDNNEEQVESNNSFIKKFLICLFIIIFVISLIIIYARYKATRDLKVNESIYKTVFSSKSVILLYIIIT